MVEKGYVCKEKDDEITVMNFLTNSEFVPIKHLLSDQDGNVTFPSSLYKIVNKDIILSDVTEEMVLELLDSLSPCIYTDKELSCLPDFEIDLAPFRNDNDDEMDNTAYYTRNVEEIYECSEVVNNCFYILQLWQKM